MSMSNNRIKRSDRIAVDLDGKNQFNLLKTYYNMKRLTNIVRVFETKHGYHVMGYFPNRTAKMNLHIRNILRDCEGRIALDTERYEWINDDSIIETLFDWKVKDGNISVESDFNLNSMPFWGMKVGKK